MFKNHQGVTNTREDNALCEETRILKLHRINEEHTEYLFISTVSSGVESNQILTVSSSSSWTFLCTSEISINTTPEKKNVTLLLLLIIIKIVLVLFPSRLGNCSKLPSERYEVVLWT